ncbi:MAG: hypothetical protein CVT93_00825 [Bacteroidetes bacterium HGW-Bacteroidetes-10]|jgi:hypothetical protein|nr:MAG: hypothetical protein CVT93_00825 [Bacteroidetes bacterium HGW-Bacteroidetes-10]
MITLELNNFGSGSVIFKNYQSPGLCVLNGKITVDPTNAAYIAANRLEFDLPAGFAMPRSAISSAILFSNHSKYHYGTVLKCWIENSKLCIEKLTAWDALGNYVIYINSAFVTRGYRGTFTQTPTKPLTIINSYGIFSFNRYCYVETEYFVFLMATFNDFPEYNFIGTGPFTLELGGFASDVNVEIPLIVNPTSTTSGQIGSMLTFGSLANRKLTFSYPTSALNMGGKSSFFNFFAVRG